MDNGTWNRHGMDMKDTGTWNRHGTDMEANGTSRHATKATTVINYATLPNIAIVTLPLLHFTVHARVYS